MNSIFNHFQVPRQLLMIAFFVFISAEYLNAQHDDHGHQKTNGEDWEKEVMTEEFKAGEMIIEHIVDSYEWHIITIGHTHVTIPLPVMLYDEGEFHFFMSSVFHHHDSYEGYYLSHNDMNTGKIVRKDANGNELYDPYTGTPIGDETGSCSYLDAVDGMEYEDHTYKGGDEGSFRWGSDEEDMDTWLDFADHIGFIISLKNSKFTIRFGVSVTDVECVNYITEFTNEKKYDFFNKPMKKFIESFITK